MTSVHPTKINIFGACHGSQYHACIGRNSYQDFQAFSEGYFLSALANLKRLIEQNDSFVEHDALINPILYSARHGIELALKYILQKLNECDLEVDAAQIHQIIKLWEEFEKVSVYDRRLQEYLHRLEPLIKQMDEADPEGQDFRYPMDREGKPTQEGKTIVDIINARTVIEYLSKELEQLCYLTNKITSERNLEAFTQGQGKTELNREELKQLSIELPNLDCWKSSSEFNSVKEKWKRDFELSNNGFSRAINFIKLHREFSGNIGNYHPFQQLTDEILRKIMDAALKAQEKHIKDDEELKSGRSLHELARLEVTPIEWKLYEDLSEYLTKDIVIEITALFELSKANYYSEEYEFLINESEKDFESSREDSEKEKVRDCFLHVFEKANFIRQIVKSLRIIGRVDLHEIYKSYIYESDEPGIIISVNRIIDVSDMNIDSQEPEKGQVLLYQTDNKGLRLECRFIGETLWLTLNQMTELFGRDKSVISKHLKAIFDDGELLREATVAKYATVQIEGSREVERKIEYYNLEAIFAVGYRVRSNKGIQFRTWATTQLKEFMVKGFVMDDERLKNPDNSVYFEQLLARIRDIRSSEKVFWRKVCDIYATSIDYDGKVETSQQFFAQVQNKMHWATHGHTAAELIHLRVDASQPNAGLTHFAGAEPRKADITVAKNYLSKKELTQLNRLVSSYLEFAELQAERGRLMKMADWASKLDDFLRLSDNELLNNAGSISAAQAKEKADLEYDAYQKVFDAEPSKVDKDLEQVIKSLPENKKD